MSDERRVAPAPNALDSAPAVPDLRASNSSKPDAESSPPPAVDVGVRRRGRMALRIPDDEVSRPHSPGPDATPAADGLDRSPTEIARVASARASGAPGAVDGSAVLRPMRIITINPPPPTTEPSEPPGEPALPPAEELDIDEEEAPLPLISRVRSTPAPSPPSSPPLETASTVRAPPGEEPPSVPAAVPAPQALALIPPPPPASAVMPSSPPVQAAPPPTVEIELPALDPEPNAEVRSDMADSEISVDDLVDATPLPRKIAATPPPARPRLASYPPAPPLSKKPAPAPAARPSKPPLVIVPPHMGSLAPQPQEGSGLRRKGRFWWEDHFNDDYLRASERLSDDQLEREVNFIEESLGVERGGAVLDLACGTGRHAVELARRGYQVVGFDLSLAMLARAGDEAQERSAKLNFVQGDMRDLTFAEQFDGVYCWNTSFGYFEEEKNALVIDRIHGALKGGGLLLLDVVNRDFLIQQSPSLAWFEGDGCVCMDEMVVDFITSRVRIKRTMMLDDGRTREMEYTMRIYSLHELGKILHDHKFKVCEVSGRIATPGVFFGHESPRTIILAEKR